MAELHAKSGDIVDVRPLGDRVPGQVSETLIRAEHIQVFRLVLPKGKILQEHKAAGAITIQCLEGVVAMEAHGRQCRLAAGELIYLADAQPHAVEALENTSLLITMMLHRT